MNLECIPRTVRPAIFAFLGLTIAAAAIALTSGALLSVASTSRLLGVIVGLMAIAVGNFVPKLRPLDARAANALSAERAAGWMLVLVGLMFVVLFASTPLEDARRDSALIGIAALLAIGVMWGWLARHSLFGMIHTTQAFTQSRKLTMWLLVAFIYVFATCCLTFLSHDVPLIRAAGAWSSVVFGIGFAILFALLESRRSSSIP